MIGDGTGREGRISATMAASDSYIFYNYTTRLCCHVSNYKKYTFDRIKCDYLPNDKQVLERLCPWLRCMPV